MHKEYSRVDDGGCKAHWYHCSRLATASIAT